MLNRWTGIGNLGADPELRSTGSGQSVASFRLACTERRKVGEEWKDHTEWVSCVAWGRDAENLHKFCKKGKQLYIEGRLQTRKWQDKEGKDRYQTEVVADVVKFLGGNEGRSEERRSEPERREPERRPDADRGRAPDADRGREERWGGGGGGYGGQRGGYGGGRGQPAGGGYGGGGGSEPPPDDGSDIPFMYIEPPESDAMRVGVRH